MNSLMSHLSWVFLSILLLVGGASIASVMFANVTERRKEIGTLMALGMTRSKVVGLFTTEGGMNSFLALIMMMVLGGPVFYWTATAGIPLMEMYGGAMDTADMGVIMAARLISTYSVNLFVGTTLLVSVIVLIVSYLPARRIAKMKPTDALRGKVG